MTPSPNGPDSAKLVLVVEDEPAIAQMLCQVLRFSGFRFERAGDGEEALARVAACRPDLIILDISMPKMDGWEVCRRLKSDPATQGIPIIIYSTQAQKKDREKGAALGADHFIGKDQDVTVVAAEVKRLI